MGTNVLCMRKVEAASIFIGTLACATSSELCELPLLVEVQLTNATNVKDFIQDLIKSCRAHAQGERVDNCIVRNLPPKLSALASARMGHISAPNTQLISTPAPVLIICVRGSAKFRIPALFINLPR